MRRRVLSLLAMLLVSTTACAQSVDPLGQWLSERGQAPAAAVGAERSRVVEMVVAAMNFVGVPYRLGGNDADTGFDCSGFTRHLFQLNLGLSLPRRSHEQAAAQGLVDVSQRDLQPGDLVFFNTLRRTFSHVGIYVGEGRFIHSPRAGASIRLEDMQTGYWQRRFDGARRVAFADTAARPSAAAPAARPHGPADLLGASH
ncbi:MAG TPA: C40 family peptidase [Burkholderiaceae bacterium]|nr:C40 family peptidase [Burkholderiaceae bacterium]